MRAVVSNVRLSFVVNLFQLVLSPFVLWTILNRVRRILLNEIADIRIRDGRCFCQWFHRCNIRLHATSLSFELLSVEIGQKNSALKIQTWRIQQLADSLDLGSLGYLFRSFRRRRTLLNLKFLACLFIVWCRLPGICPWLNNKSIYLIGFGFILLHHWCKPTRSFEVWMEITYR